MIQYNLRFNFKILLLESRWRYNMKQNSEYNWTIKYNIYFKNRVIKLNYIIT